MAEKDYDELSKDELVTEIKKRNGKKTSGDEGYIPTSGNKDELVSRLRDDSDAPRPADGAGTTTPTDGVGQPHDDDHTEPTTGNGGGAAPQGTDDEDGDTELSENAGQPATAEVTRLQLLEQHGTSTEGVEQAEEIEASLEDRREEAKSNVETVDDVEAKAIFDHNTGVPLWRRNTEDLTEEQKQAPSDHPTPNGDGAVEYSEEHQQAADAEREKKNATLPKFDTRDEYDDDVEVGDELKTERQGAGGRGDVLRSDDNDGTPEYVGGSKRSIYTPEEDTTWREIATLLGLNRPEEIAHINGRFDGTAHVPAGSKVLLPDGYDYQ